MVAHKMGGLRHNDKHLGLSRLDSWALTRALRHLGFPSSAVSVYFGCHHHRGMYGTPPLASSQQWTESSPAWFASRRPPKARIGHDRTVRMPHRAAASAIGIDEFLHSVWGLTIDHCLAELAARVTRYQSTAPSRSNFFLVFLVFSCTRAAGNCCGVACHDSSRDAGLPLPGRRRPAARYIIPCILLRASRFLHAAATVRGLRGTLSHIHSGCYYICANARQTRTTHTDVDLNFHAVSRQKVTMTQRRLS